MRASTLRTALVAAGVAATWQVVRQQWGGLLNRDPHLFLGVTRTCEVRLDQGARTRVPPLLYWVPFLSLAQHFLVGHPQLRYKAFVDRPGCVLLRAPASGRTRLPPRGPHLWTRRVVKPRRPSAFRVQVAASVKHVVIRRGFPPAVPVQVCQNERVEIICDLTVTLLTRSILPLRR